MNNSSQARVLVIEDEYASAADLQEQLHGMGYELTGVASSEDEAARSIESDRPDLILLGLHLQKDSEGVEIAEIVQRRFNIPVSLMTGRSDDQVLTSRPARSERFLTLSADQLFSGTGDVSGGTTALRERQKYFWLSSAMNSAADGIMVVNAQGMVQFLNPAAEHLSGCPKEQALGHHFRSVLIFEHHGARIADDFVRLATLNEAPLNLGNELYLVAPDGQRREVEAEVAAAIDSLGAFGSVVFTFRDITQRKWEEHQHRQEHAIRAVERLAETTAHTLNNLLTSILGNCELLLSDTGLSSERRGKVTEVHSAAVGVAAVVGRLSAISRTRFVTHEEINLNSVIETLLPTLSDSIPAGIEISTQLDPDLAHINADRGQLEQILFALVTNARDAISSTGRILVSTENVIVDVADRAGSKRTFAAVKVLDTGEGMTEETCSQIFEPFFTLRSNSGHAGLGLSIAQGIIRDYKGFIDVKSEPGAGSEFKFGLPSIEEDPFAYLDQNGPEPSSLSTRTILLVEDDHSVRLLVRNILERNDYQVIEAQNAEDALMVAQLQDGRVDLLVTDVSMPGISGPDLVREFAPLHPETRFLLISGFSADRVGRGSSLPPNINFLQKPFRQKELLGTIEGILSRK